MKQGFKNALLLTLYYQPVFRQFISAIESVNTTTKLLETLFKSLVGGNRLTVKNAYNELAKDWIAQEPETFDLLYNGLMLGLDSNNAQILFFELFALV